jgi:hypothetical protein
MSTASRILMSSILGAMALLCSMTPIFAADVIPTGRFTVGDYLDLQSASDPQISPDGTQVVYTRTTVDKMADKPQTAVLSRRAPPCCASMASTTARRT